MIKISYKYRKYLWMGGALAAALLLYVLVFDPLYQDYKNTLDRIDMARMKLEHSRKLLLEQERLDSQIRQLQAAIRTRESWMFKGETAALVGAQMQEIMNGICSKNGAIIRQTRLLKVRDLGPYKEIPISMDLSSSVSGLAKIIFDLNHHSYLFIIPEITTRVSNQRNPKDVRTRMTVVGLMRGK